MSIWSSITGPAILAADGEDPDAHYRGEGEATIDIDVATTGQHNLIRLALFGSGPTGVIDVEALLSSAAARELAARLLTAVGDGE